MIPSQMYSAQMVHTTAFLLFSRTIAFTPTDYTLGLLTWASFVRMYVGYVNWPKTPIGIASFQGLDRVLSCTWEIPQV